MNTASLNSPLLTGRVCLVTGAAKGLGKATAEAFAREGATVYANDRDVSGMVEWADALAARYQVQWSSLSSTSVIVPPPGQPRSQSRATKVGSMCS